MKSTDALILIIAVALALRLSVIPLYGEHMIGDEIWNLEVSQSVFSYPPLYTPKCYTKLEPQSEPCPTSYRPPLYPILLSFFNSTLGKRGFTAILGALIIIPTFFIANHYYGRKVGLLASLFVAIHPLLIYKSVQLINRNLTILLILIALYIALKQKWKIFACISGLTYLTNYTSVFFLIPLFILIKEKKKALILFLIILSPWLIRNYMIFGDPFFTPSRYAFTFYHWSEIKTLDEPRSFSAYIDGVGGWSKAIAIRLINPLLTYLPLTKAPNPVEFLLYYHGLGVFSPLILLTALLFMVDSLSRLKWNHIMNIIVFTSLTTPLLYGCLKAGGTANESLIPLAPLFAILCAKYVIQKPKWTKIAIISLILQGVVMLLVWGGNEMWMLRPW